MIEEFVVVMHVRCELVGFAFHQEFGPQMAPWRPFGRSSQCPVSGGLTSAQVALVDDVTFDMQLFSPFLAGPVDIYVFFFFLLPHQGVVVLACDNPADALHRPRKGAV